MRDTLILPCRHLCLCNACADTLRYQANNCPICRLRKCLLMLQRAALFFHYYWDLFLKVSLSICYGYEDKRLSFISDYTIYIDLPFLLVLVIEQSLEHVVHQVTVGEQCHLLEITFILSYLIRTQLLSYLFITVPWLITLEPQEIYILTMVTGNKRTHSSCPLVANNIFYKIIIYLSFYMLHKMFFIRMHD